MEQFLTSLILASIVGLPRFVLNNLLEILFLFLVWRLRKKENRDKFIAFIKDVIQSVAGSPGRLENSLNAEKSDGVEAENLRLRHLLRERDLSQAKPVEKQYLLLGQYYNQGLTQSSLSFRFSIISAFLGFAVIVVSLARIDSSSQQANQISAYVGLISGTIINAVSALFFVETNRSRKLMTEFFEKLRADRKLDESLELIEKIPDQVIQSKVKAIMTLEFAGIKLNDNISLENLLNTKVAFSSVPVDASSSLQVQRHESNKSSISDDL
ncbi:hypothetical protein H6F93_30885 [Leptolyngbya sp. FACHB-671]|uniref:TRADD-N-associated membrane domain-containing protein n=1 Tax=Leptolyngbya sp. FACHB-671 TaxID=2692812 RepID=UPI001681D382|nr:hypothetical protein [Leptolyngbya sp. FACHB-671]MBD2071877.1 hypothetical protein [Leptolyngbya sp. FACHB-671]